VRVRTHGFLLLQEHAGRHRIVDVALRVGGRQKTGHLIRVGIVGATLVRDEIRRERRETDLGVASDDVLVVLQQAAVFVDDHDA